jgi:ketosteroid isomerase-like protein
MKNLFRRHPVMFWALALILSAPGAAAQDQPGLTLAKLDAWMQGYKAAWETLDADKAAALFTEDATYQDEAFTEPYRGRAGIRQYWADVTRDQKDVKFTYATLAAAGNTGIAHWHAEFTQPSSGSAVILDGVFVLDFAPDGLCKSLREWWFIRINPPA